jgi:hypothetical protein
MSADKDRGIRRQKQKRAKQQKKEARPALKSGESQAAPTSSPKQAAA